jgi:hypothetical protein
MPDVLSAPRESDITVSESTGMGTHRSRAPWPTPGCVLGRRRYRLLSKVSCDDRYGISLWRGRDLVLDRDVALTLFTAQPQDFQAVTQIRSAIARALHCARLETAGAARVLDVLEPESGHGPTVAVIVAEWTRGFALLELLDNGPLPPSMAAGILVSLAGAVDAAHSAGLILGCDDPNRIRVTPDRRARLAFPGPPPVTGSGDDIRGLGAILYLLLTGYWPLPDGPPNVPSAPIGPNGRPVSPAALRPEVPVELSTLALRSIAGPGNGGGVHTGAAVRQVLELNASTDANLSRDPLQAQRQRRVKFGVSMAVLAAVTLLILGYTGMQVVSVFTNPGGTPLVVAGNTPTEPATQPAVASAPAAVKLVSVYDPSGKGRPDHQKDIGKVLDGNPSTGWSTDSYRQQFPSYKKGLGVMLSFDQPIAAAAVTVMSPSPGTVLEIRTAASPTAPLAQTTVVGTGTLGRGNTQIPLAAGPPTRYLLVWITELGGETNRHQSKFSELGVQQRST